MNLLGEQIKSARKKAKITQEQLARLSNISTMSIRRYESGNRVPTIDVINKIASALNIDSVDILGIPEDELDYLNKASIALHEDIETSESLFRVYEHFGYNIKYSDDNMQCIIKENDSTYTVNAYEIERMESEILSYIKFKLSELLENK